jgi:UDPglucose 6-dehydrogenase
MNIAVIGAGYVGLVSGTCLADVGHSVVCVDVDRRKVERLKAFDIPIYEPGLEALVRRNVEAERLSFTDDLAAAVGDAEIVLIAVGTPPRPEDGQADLTYVRAAAREIAGAVKSFAVVVTKSTVPVGTGDEIERIIAETNPDADVVVASNPEFLREGAAIADFMQPDRIVIGVEDSRAHDLLAALYPAEFFTPEKVLFLARRTAELIKYGANAFLAMKITFINEMADLCEKTGADVEEVARGIGMDRRIGGAFFKAGPGYGGSCFPKDTMALLKIGHEVGTPLRMVEATLASNEARKVAMAQRVINASGGDVRGKRIAVLGLTFKPNTDDMREAPSIKVIEALQAKGAIVSAYDPAGMQSAREYLDHIDYAADAYAAAENAVAVVLMTEWDEFRSLDLVRLRGAMRTPVLFDFRNVFVPETARRAGFKFYSIGRPDQGPATLRKGSHLRLVTPQG